MLWITVDVHLWKHPKMAALPSDSARYGWLVTLSEAKLQRKPGTFASEAHYREVVGRFGKFMTAYLDAKLLEPVDGGGLHVHDWRKHQWAVAQARHRDDSDETAGGHDDDDAITNRDRDRDSKETPLPPKRGLRANGESPRQLAEARKLERQKALDHIQKRYLNGELNEEQARQLRLQVLGGAA